MALSQQEFQKLKARLTEQKAKQNEPDLFSRIGEAFSSRVGKAQEAQEKTISGEQSLASGTLQTIGQGAGFVTDIGAETLRSIPGAKTVESAVSGIIKKGAETETGQKVVSSLTEWAKQHPEASKNLQSIVDIASLIPVGKVIGTGVGLAEKGAIKTAEKAITAGEEAIDLTKRATAKIIKATEPVPPTPVKAVGQILQGETTDIPSGIKGLSALDTKGVKTYSELKTKIDEKIVELSRKVDEDLAIDTTKRPLKDLIISSKTTSGKIVKTTPVKNALEQLDELYTKTGDTVSSANIKELIQKAKTDGLTNQEINDIARVYGTEFKNKAFSRTGDPLTSVNAQLYENTRKSVKELARQGIKGKEATQADKVMSSLFNMNNLVERNIQAVNKLQQRISERGLFEKVGHTVSKYGDILTGGSLRGFVGGLLPRGAGYKVLNSLDLEKALEKNLQIIQEAIKGKTDDEVVKILKKLESK